MIEAKFNTALYSVGTWDTNIQAFTPQHGLTVESFNISKGQLRQALRELRRFGYSAHRLRDSDGWHEDNDYLVLVERTDGENPEAILRRWKR